ASTSSGSVASCARGRASAPSSTKSSLPTRPSRTPAIEGASTMLTADHVRVRKKAGELIVRRLDAKERARAAELAETYLAIARANVGRTRDELVELWAAVPVAPRDRKL